MRDNNKTKNTEKIKKAVKPGKSAKPSKTSKASKVAKPTKAGKQAKAATKGKNEKEVSSRRKTDKEASARRKSSPVKTEKRGDKRKESPVRSIAGKIRAGRSKKANMEKLNIIPIGGLNEIGKNMTLLEYGEEMMIIDCGMSFPESEMFGIDVVIPDFSYVVNNAKKIKGLVVTHGHEDHIGAIPYLLKQISVPIYATRITLALIENKLKEHGIVGDLRAIKAGDTIRIGNSFTCETIRTTHSVADAICLYITTPTASLFHTGDFKIDYTPIDGEPIDLSRFADIGRKGVDVMLADSTNALRQGFTKSEQYVAEALDKIFQKVEGRIIIATFSSNVHRVQKIIELTAKYGRRFTVSGRSMENVVNIAQELGYIKVPKGLYVELNQKSVNSEDMVVITTGSQGEPMSALARMSSDEHRMVKLREGDTVILSSTPVPGNEKSVSNVVNKLYDKGVDVIYNDIADIHVSGHACQEELKLIHSLIKPTFFMPVHGESRHLMEHKKLAESLGQKEENIFILSNGDKLSVNKREASKEQHAVNADDILVDGLGIGDVGNVVLNDRKRLSTSGLIMIAAAIDFKKRAIISGPEIVTRGFIYVKEHEDMVSILAQKAEYAILECLENKNVSHSDVDGKIKEVLRRFITKETQRNPILLPVILEV